MRSIVFALIAVMVATSASAGQNGRGPKGRNEPPARETSRVELSVGAAGFDLSVQQTISGYYSGKPKKGSGGLPPGVAKNYARGKPLPPGIAKRALPSDLRARLPVYPGHEYVVVGRDVLLISVRTGIVADIMIDIAL
jgi:hypothetical protein